MKLLPPTKDSVAQEATIVSTSVKVCMHILKSVHKDVRGLRASAALVEAGFTVSTVDIEGESARSPEETIDGVRVKHMMVSSSFIATRFQRWALIRAAWLFIRGTIRLLRTPADVYHALDLPAFPACYIAAQLRRKPLIFETYELPLLTLPVSELKASRRWLHALLAPLLAAMVPRCAAVIAVSPPIIQELRKRYHCPEVLLIRNVPTYRAVSKSDRLRQQLGLGPQVRIALYQGGLQTNRGLDRLVRAAAFLERDIVIVMMGKAMHTVQAQLEALIASEGVADRVKFLPQVPYAELLDWTASADIGLIVYTPDYSPNVQMMLPNKLFEYLMAGLPVLASQLEAVSDVIRTYGAGQIVSSLAPADVGAAINRMLADQAALDLMRRNALDAAQHVFCWEKERGELIRLYHKLLYGRKYPEVLA